MRAVDGKSDTEVEGVLLNVALWWGSGGGGRRWSASCGRWTVDGVAKIGCRVVSGQAGRVWCQQHLRILNLFSTGQFNGR
jgi:hypothetical protein